MKVLYVDNNGKYMEMESDKDPTITITTIIKHNKWFDSIALLIDPDAAAIKTMQRNTVRGKNKFEYFIGVLKYSGGGISREENWKLNITSELTEAVNAWYNAELPVYISYFIKNHCLPGKRELTSIYNKYYTYYLEDVTVTEGTNCVMNLYGRGHIYTQNLQNVLINIFGDYDIN